MTPFANRFEVTASAQCARIRFLDSFGAGEAQKEVGSVAMARGDLEDLRRVIDEVLERSAGAQR